MKVHYYCKIDLNKIGCANDADCIAVNGVCDLNNFRCKDPNINLQMYFSGEESDCISLGGEWLLGLG